MTAAAIIIAAVVAFELGRRWGFTQASAIVTLRLQKLTEEDRQRRALLRRSLS